MDSDLFRIILLVLGIVLVLGLFAWDRYRTRPEYMRGTRKAPAESAARRHAHDDFGDVEQELGLIEQVIRGQDEDFDVGQPYVVSRRESRARAAAGAAPPPAPAASTPPRTAAAVPERRPGTDPAATGASLPEQPPAKRPDPARDPESQRLLTLTLISRGGTFSGIRLRRAFNEAQLSFGPMSIFHRRNSGETLFSVANLVVPGTFDPSTMDGFSSPGLALFVTLPGPADPVAAFEAMYECAQQMASRLDADLCDARRKPLDATALAALRDEAGRAAGT